MRCKRCNTEKPLESFHKNTHMRTGYLSVCKECANSKRKVKNPAPYPRYRKYSKELMTLCLKMRKQGYCYQVIEAETGVPKAAIQNYI